MKTATDAESAVQLFAMERSLAELAGLAMLVMSLWFPAPADFGVLASLSLAAVAAASALLAWR